MILLLTKNYAEAEAEARASMGLWPDDAEAHSILATALGSQGRDSEAVPEAREALRLFPRHKAAHIQLAFSLTRSRQYKEAIPVLREIIPRSPEMPLLQKHLATCLLHTGEIEGAISELGLFLKTSPGDAEGHYSLGVALRQKGHTAEAQAHFREAARLEPNNPVYETVAHGDVRGESSTDAAAARPDEGSISGNVYTNRFFGFVFEFPKDWTVVRTDTARAVAKLGGTLLANGDPVLQDVTQAGDRTSYPLLSLIEGMAGTRGMSTRTIQIIATDMRSQPDLKSGEEFLKFSATMYRELGLPLEVVGVPRGLEFGGKKFSKAELAIHMNNDVQHGAQIVAIEKGYVLQFLLVSPDSQGLEEILKTMDTLRFREAAN